MQFLIPVFIFASLFIPKKHVDKELEPYVDEYLSLVETICPGGKIKLPTSHVIHKQPRSARGDYVGTCMRIPPFLMEVTVFDHYWKHMDPIERKSTMFHELSHCLLDRDHSLDFGHYMYYSQNVVSEMNLYQQVEEDIKWTCESGSP